MTQVKICGVTTPEDAEAAIDAGADSVGLNFHPPSARWVEPERARWVREALGNRVKVVGVFVDRPAAEVRALAESFALDLVQLHGNESPEDFANFPFPLVRAVRVKEAASLDSLLAWEGVEAFVLDGVGRPGAFGGRTFDWSLATRPLPAPVWLAGGLTADNVGDAIRAVRPALVDVASGVEFAPGRKDPSLMKAFVKSVREVSR